MENNRSTCGSAWDLVLGEGPVVAVANHHGHQLREEIARLCALSDDERLREEDPRTGEWAAVAPTHLIVQRSRFEVDLNRSRETAVYRQPEDAWGLNLWTQPLTDDLVTRSLAEYDAYYAELERILAEKALRYGRFVVLDLHSYNHRRDGPGGAVADPAGNPEINVGTGTMDRGRWGPLVDGFIGDLRRYDFPGRQLDVRENVKFVGRQFPRWVHTRFPDSGCALAVEAKKFFMDEWSGEVDEAQHSAIRGALASVLPGLLNSLMDAGARL